MASIAQATHLPALGEHRREEVGRELQATLVELVDLSLIGKQLHWNLVGTLFKPLHEHLDELVDSWRDLGDTVAERAVALGFSPDGQAAAVSAGSGIPALERWDFSIVGEVDEPRRWTWDELRALPSEEITRDIHCVTKWSKLDTVWQGVSVDTLLEGIETSAENVTQFADGGYTTNLPLEDVTGGKAWIAFGYDGEPLEPEHGRPARMLVPHLYFWKSAKWIRGLRLEASDAPGLWETNGYHNYGDPWREQRYWGD